VSYGLVCLTCRKYITDEVTDHGCKCERPRPSLDAKRECSNNVLPKRYGTRAPR
jgi:hypothetical protein